MSLHKNANNFVAGMRFGRLVVLGGYERRNGRVYWSCQCDCGSITAVSSSRLNKGTTKSCGCLRLAGIRYTKRGTHGMTASPTYYSWTSMHTRCSNPNAKGFELYGGRGIAVCRRWSSFDAFLADMGERPEGTTLDRIDVDGNYEAGNCRWATRKEQNRNKRNQHWIEFRGERMTVADCCDLHGIGHDDAGYVYSRLLTGWDVERAFITPPRSYA